jgi:hypothetical protein
MLTTCMLERITSLDDPRLRVLKDDPVRPHIPAEMRVNDRGTIFLWTDHDEIKAAVCVMFCDHVPESEEDMFTAAMDKSVAVAYTIWSYSAGAARELIFAVRDLVKDTASELVTLSPQTEMAHRFHIKNGAYLIRENATTWNFEYSLSSSTSSTS